MIEHTEAIASELATNSFELLHSLEGTELFFFDGWWMRLQETHGALLDHRVLGAVSNPEGGETTLLRLRYKRGAEILKLAWRDSKVLGTTIGAPYPSMVLLQPTSESSLVA